MHAVSNNQIADILHFNDNNLYLLHPLICISKGTKNLCVLEVGIVGRKFSDSLSYI